MKERINCVAKAHLFRGAFYILLLLAFCAVHFALGQQSATSSGVDPANMSLAGRISSMSEAADAQPSNTPAPAATAVVVWDQYNNAGTAVTLSSTLTDAPAMNSDLADDFDVQGYTWVVRWIDVDGAYFNGPGPANTFTVVFYSDNDGFPGNQVYATFAWWEQNGSTFRLHVCDDPKTCQSVLFPGRYWVEIQANMTAKCCGEWGWTDRTVTDLDPAVWRNPNSNPNGVADPNTYIVNAYCNPNVDANSLANPDGYRNTAVLFRPIHDNADRREYRAGHDGHRKSLG